MASGPVTGLTANPAGYTSVQLAWTNPSPVALYHDIYRNGAFLTSITGSADSYLDNSCQDGVYYEYYIESWYDEVLYYTSSTVSATTPLIPPSGLSGSGSPTSVSLSWNDNTGNESGYKIYRYGSLLATKGQSVTSHVDSGLAPGSWYRYYVTAYNGVTESAPSNEIEVFTSDPPTAPSGLAATAVSTSQINLSWNDNSSNETGFKVEESADGSTGWALIETLGAGVTTYSRTGLASNTLRYYRVYAYNDSGNSGNSNTANARTFAAISDPTNLVATPYSDTQIELTFQDNSSEEDDHRVERKTGAGAFAEVATLKPNQDFYRDSSLVKGSTYTYRVRAKQGGSYSGYSNEASATTISEPSAPTGLALSEVKDTSMRLTWTLTSGETGYKIEKSTNGVDYTEIAKVTAGVSCFLAAGLSPSTQYWFRVRAYNIAGNSSYATAVNDTTLSEYAPTSFEDLVRRPISVLVYLVEINPKITLSGFTLTSGKTYTYEATIEERGINLVEVFENGAALTSRSSIALVESNAGSFYFDYFNRKLYVHTTGSVAPINSFLEGAFYLYFTNYSHPDSPTVFNDCNYLPLLERASIPDVTQEITPLYEGSFSISSGSVAVKNAYFPDGWYWDKRYALYTLRGRKVVVRAGGPGFAHADFDAIFTALIASEDINDRTLTLSLEDFRGAIHRDVPINHFWQTDYPNLSDNDNGKEIPLAFGTRTGVVPVCCDPTNRKYKLNDGRIKSVTAVRQNGVALVAGTDYFIDYQRGVVILARGLALDNADTIDVDFEGTPNSANELLTNGADIFIWLCTNILGLSLAELDLDSIYQTKYTATATLAAYVQKTVSSEEIIRTLEHSLRAHTFQDTQGRLGLKRLSSTVPSDIRYVGNHQIFDFSRSRSLSSLYKRINVYYAQNPQKEDEWSVASTTYNQAEWKHRVSESLDIYTYLTASADASALAAAIRDELDKDIISFTVNAILFGCQVGDLVYFSRDRFPSLNGMANNVLLRILSITKQVGAGRTAIRAEVVS